MILIKKKKLNRFQLNQKTLKIKINKNQEDIQDLEISVGKIETMLEERFDKLESLIMEM